MLLLLQGATCQMSSNTTNDPNQDNGSSGMRLVLTNGPFGMPMTVVMPDVLPQR